MGAPKRGKKFSESQRQTFPIEAAAIEKDILVARAKRVDTAIHKATLVGAVDVLRNQLPDELESDARKGLMTDELYKFVYQSSFIAFQDAMVANGLSVKEFEELFLGYSLGARLVMMYQLSIFGWFAKNGSEGLSESTATNDFLDVDYVMIATYNDGIISKESRVNWLCQRAKEFFEFQYRGASGSRPEIKQI